MSIDNRFVYLDEAAPGITWDAKYAGSDNLTGAPLNGYNANRTVGTRELGAALEKARRYFEKLGYGLLVWDAYRPESGVQSFVEWAALPEDYRTKSAHYPRLEKPRLFELGYIAERSGHSRGSNVDLTLTKDGYPVDMGGIFDLMDEVSHHGYPVPEPAFTNRLILKEGMEKCGFRPFKNEWWHYNLIDEPYPDTYFNFPIE